MQTLKSFLDQSLLIWKDSTAAARFGIGLLTLICVGAVIGVGIWSSQPYYIVLASDLEPSQASKVIDALEAGNISYQIKGSGSIILVDKRKWSRARIVAGELGIGSVDSALEDVSPWMDPKNQQNVFRRNLERQLEGSIQRFKTVEVAKVHLSIPEKQAFMREREAPSASVVLEVRRNAKFGESQAAAIASLVANAVNGLTIDKVAISDTAGNVYSTDESLGRLSKQEEFRVMRDRELSQKAELILMKFLGVGNASVAITTDFTFPDGTSTVTEYDPDSKVIVSEVIKNETKTGGNRTASGVAGTASNFGTAPKAADEKVVISKVEDLDNQYEVSSTMRTETITTPILNLMTVSVLVNSTTVQDENKVIPPKVKEKIEALVSQAVGFREDKDQIAVEFFEFVDPVLTDVPVTTGFAWEKINQVLKNISLGLAAIIALFVAIKAFKKVLPAPVVVAEPNSDRKTQVNQLSDLVKENPEVFSKIIESWSSLNTQSGQNSPGQNNKKAA